MGSIIIDDVAILKCPICLDVYDKPKLLSCGHTFCAKCIDQLLVSSRELNTQFACPECRRSVEIPLRGTDSLPPNFVIQRLLDDRGRANNVANAWAQADSDVDGLTRLVFRFKQKQRSLEESRNKVMEAVRQEEAAIQQKGDQVKQRVDEELDKLLDTLYKSRDLHLTKIASRQERVQIELDTVVRFCALYGNTRRNIATQESEDLGTTEHRLRRLHTMTQELLNLRKDNDDEDDNDDDDYDDDLQVPSYIFSPASAAGDIIHKSLVGQLSDVHESQSTLEATVAQGKAVWGMTVVDNKLYILRDRYATDSYVDVYDAETFSRLSRPRHFPRLRGATDITSSSRHACLYVGDEVDKCLFKVGLSQGCEKWPLDNHKPWCVSVTFRDNVLVTLYDINAVMEFRPDGKCVRWMSLELAGIVHAQQVLQVCANQLIVCHATSRISRLDSDGTLISSHGGLSATTGQSVHGPCHLVVDRNNFIYAADVLHRRVVLYSPDVDFVRDVVGDSQLKWFPLRVAVDNHRRRLYVADNNFDGQKYTSGRVLVFSL